MDKNKPMICGVRKWIAFVYHKTAKFMNLSADATTPNITTGEWKKDFHARKTSETDYFDFPGVHSIGAGWIDLRRGYVVAVAIFSKDGTRALRKVAASLEYNVDVFTAGKDSWVHVHSFGNAYGGGAGQALKDWGAQYNVQLVDQLNVGD